MISRSLLCILIVVLYLRLALLQMLPVNGGWGAELCCAETIVSRIIGFFGPELLTPPTSVHASVWNPLLWRRGGGKEARDLQVL